MSIEIVEAVVVRLARGTTVYERTPEAEAAAESACSGDHVASWDFVFAAVDRESGEAYIIDNDYHPGWGPLQLVESPSDALQGWYALTNVQRKALGLPTDEDVDDPEEFFRGWRP